MKYKKNDFVRSVNDIQGIYIVIKYDDEMQRFACLDIDSFTFQPSSITYFKEDDLIPLDWLDDESIQMIRKMNYLDDPLFDIKKFGSFIFCGTHNIRINKRKTFVEDKKRVYYLSRPDEYYLGRDDNYYLEINKMKLTKKIAIIDSFTNGIASTFFSMDNLLRVCLTDSILLNGDESMISELNIGKSFLENKEEVLTKMLFKIKENIYADIYIAIGNEEIDDKTNKSKVRYVISCDGDTIFDNYTFDSSQKRVKVSMDLSYQLAKYIKRMLDVADK